MDAFVYLVVVGIIAALVIIFRIVPADCPFLRIGSVVAAMFVFGFFCGEEVIGGSAAQAEAAVVSTVTNSDPMQDILDGLGQ